MAEQMESMQQMFTQSDVSRAMVDEKMGKLADSVDRMSNRMEAAGTGPSTGALERVARSQEQLVGVLEKHFENGGDGGDGIDAESRMRLRSIDVQMLRILEEISAGRQETMAELRNDISMLASALGGAGHVVQRRALRSKKTLPTEER
jgi:hypothetical protein